MVFRLTLAYFALRAQLVETFREIRAAQGNPLRQFLQPMERSTDQSLELSA